MVLTRAAFTACLIACLQFLFTPEVLGWSTLHDWALVVATQAKAHQPLPVPSAYGAGLTLSEAYAVQKLAVQRLVSPREVAGFRAALTRPRGQVALGITTPITGVVPKGAILRGEPVLLLREYRALTVAPGLGFILRAPVTQRVRDPAAVQALIAAVVPVIDFANPRFEFPDSVTATDLVAGNAGTARLLVGKPFPDTAPATFNGTLVELARAGTIIDRGRGVNLMGSQQKALAWLINSLLEQGWNLPKGTLLVTGGLSDPVPARPGEYEAHFWDLGRLAFRVRP